MDFQVDEYQYDINVDNMHEIFKRYGNVLKIAIFQKNNLWQALVQYPDHAVRPSTAVCPAQVPPFALRKYRRLP